MLCVYQPTFHYNGAVIPLYIHVLMDGLARYFLLDQIKSNSKDERLRGTTLVRDYVEMKVAVNLCLHDPRRLRDYLILRTLIKLVLST